MFEQPPHRVIIDENVDEHHPDYEHFDLAKRNDFQMRLMVEMIGKDATSAEKLAWSDAYGKRFSAILDNKKNEYVRNCVNAGEYAEASRLILTALRYQETAAA
ncbi:MAG: hypothetical protein KGH93_02315 [Patescibacteria group bacterium]|nr:hypothetical protein [Patescibacteria group bacterium]MDE1946011.1 hypothetical protein [Patescibacteria group bacterium]